MKINSYFILLFIVLVSSCNIAKRLTNKNIDKTQKLSTNQLIDSIKTHQVDFNTLQIKYNASFKSNKKSIDFTGLIRILEDSVIWINMKLPLGIEVARTIMTSDSVKLINRINRTYYNGDYEFISKNLKNNIDFALLQNMLVANYIDYIKSFEKLEFSKDSTSYNINCKHNNKLHNIKFTNNNYSISNFNLKDTLSNQTINIDYFMRNENNVNYPEKIAVKLNSKGKDSEILIKYLDFKKDINISTPFKINSKYTPISND